MADFRFQGRRDLVLLEIDQDRVGPEVLYEGAENGELFPHIYGPINLDAVVRLLPFQPRDDGGFDLPAGLTGAGEDRASAITIDRLDHLVLTVADLDATCAFYSDVLGMRVERFGEGRLALRFGFQKINLHKRGAEFEPHAARPEPGSADICLLSSTPMSTVVARLAEKSVDIVEGPVRRTGALGPIESVYFRDPDGNLIEVSNRVGSGG